MSNKTTKTKKVAITLPLEQVTFVERKCYSLSKMVQQMLRERMIEDLKSERGRDILETEAERSAREAKDAAEAIARMEEAMKSAELRTAIGYKHVEDLPK